MAQRSYTFEHLPTGKVVTITSLTPPTVEEIRRELDLRGVIPPSSPSPLANQASSLLPPRTQDPNVDPMYPPGSKRGFFSNVARGTMELTRRPGELISGTVAGLTGEEKDWTRGLRAFAEPNLADSRIHEDFNKVMEERGWLADKPRTRAAVGFAADVMTDPLNLLGGAGLIRRGLIKGASVLGPGAARGMETAIVKTPQAVWRKTVVDPVKKTGNWVLSKGGKHTEFAPAAQRRLLIGPQGRSLEQKRRLESSFAKGEIQTRRRELDKNLIEKITARYGDSAKPTIEDFRIVGKALQAPLTTSGKQTAALQEVMNSDKLRDMYLYAKQTFKELADIDVKPIRQAFPTSGTAPSIVKGAGRLMAPASPLQSMMATGTGSWNKVQKSLNTLSDADLLKIEKTFAHPTAFDEFGAFRGDKLAYFTKLPNNVKKTIRELLRVTRTTAPRAGVRGAGGKFGENIGTITANLRSLRLKSAQQAGKKRMVSATVSSEVPNYVRRLSVAQDLVQPIIHKGLQPISKSSLFRKQSTEDYLKKGGETNVYTALLDRIQTSARATSDRRLIAETFTEFGHQVLPKGLDVKKYRRLAPDVLEKLPESLRQIAFLDRFIPNAAADMIEKRLVRLGQGDELASAALAATRLFKTFATAINLPSHQVINFTGNIFNMYAYGMSPAQITKHYAKAALDLRKVRKSTRSLQELNMPHLQEASRSGTIGELTGFKGEFDVPGKVQTGVTEKVRNPLNPDNPFYRGARSINQDLVEDPAKLAMFRWARRNGRSVEDAALDVKAALFDYSELTNFEKGWMRNAIPFYTWTRKNVPLQIANVLERPGRIANQGRLLETYNDILMAYETDTQGLLADPLDRFSAPANFREGGTVNLPDLQKLFITPLARAVGLGGKPGVLDPELVSPEFTPARTEGGSPVATSVRLPFFDLDLLSLERWKDRQRDLGFMINPLVRIPFEALAKSRIGEDPDRPTQNIYSDRLVDASTLGRLSTLVPGGKQLTGTYEMPAGPKQTMFSKWLSESLPLPLGAMTRGVGSQPELFSQEGSRDALPLKQEVLARAMGLTPRVMTPSVFDRGEAEWDREYAKVDPDWEAEGILREAQKYDRGQASQDSAPFDRTGLPEMPTRAQVDIPLPHDFALQDLIDRVRQVESGGDPTAVSPKGALGEMQVLPTTAIDPGFGVKNIFTMANEMGIFIPTRGTDLQKAEVLLLKHPNLNQRFGISYLSALLDKYNGNVAKALVAYNAGHTRASTWTGNRKDISHLPTETQEYLRKILPDEGY